MNIDTDLSEVGAPAQADSRFGLYVPYVCRFVTQSKNIQTSTHPADMDFNRYIRVYTQSTVHHPAFV